MKNVEKTNICCFLILLRIYLIIYVLLCNNCIFQIKYDNFLIIFQKKTIFLEKNFFIQFTLDTFSQ